MTKIEEKIFDYIKNNSLLFITLLFSMLGLVLRYSLRDILSHDAIGYLLPWYEERKALGGLSGLDVQVGDYNMVYQFFIAIMTYIPINPLYQYKLLSVIFDYFLAAGVGVLVYDLANTSSTVVNQNIKERSFALRNAVVAYTITLFSLIVVMNSSAWAQCDSIYSSFIIWSIVCLLREKYFKSFILLGLAFSFKLQSVFIIPFFLFVYFWRKRYSFFYYAFIPLMMIVTCIPNIIAGRSIVDVFKVYLSQTNSYGQLWMKYPSFWTIFPDTEFGANPIFPDFHRYKNMASILVVAYLCIIMLLVMYKKINDSNKNQLYIAFLLTYTTVLFLPCMHERYGYLYEIMAIVIIFLNKKTIIPALFLHMISIYQYGGCLGIELLPMNMQQLSMINVITWIIYCQIIFSDMKNQDDESVTVENLSESDIKGIKHISKLEKNIILLIDKYKEVIILILFSLLGLAVRFFLRNIFFQNANQGFGVLGINFSIRASRYISIIGDYCIALLASFLLSSMTEKKDKKKKLFIVSYLIFLFLPILLLDSAVAGWGNSVYVALILLALIMLIKKYNYILVFFIIGLACMININAIVIVPFLIFLYLYKRDFSIINFVILIAMSIIGLKLSANKEDTAYLYHNFPSFWAFLDEKNMVYFMATWIVLAVVLIVMLLILLNIKNNELMDKNPNLLHIAYFCIYVTITFSPCMDQSSLYLISILAILVAIYNKIMIIPAVFIQVMCLYLYTESFYGLNIMPFSVSGLAWINIILLIICIYLVWNNNINKYDINR